MTNNMYTTSALFVKDIFCCWLIVLGTLLGVPTAHAQATKLEIDLVSIPKGTFTMGACKISTKMAAENKKDAYLGQKPSELKCSANDPEASDDETPTREVFVSEFMIGKTEVTLGQFKVFLSQANRKDLIDDTFIKVNNQGDNSPVVMVSWEDVQYFIDWLNQTQGGGWRLPTEAEWEYACRAKTQNLYCGSNDVNAVAWYDGNRAQGSGIRPVAQKQPNSFGLYDMAGNVWEWLQDCRTEDYRKSPNTSKATSTGCVDGKRVLRGGSWGDPARRVRATYRNGMGPDVRHSTIGFRLAKTVGTGVQMRRRTTIR